MRMLAPSLRWIALAGAVASVTVTSSAHADPGAEVTAASATPAEDTTVRAPRATSRWYGWQTLATDGAAIALAGLSMASDGSTSSAIFGASALGTYVLGGPTVHAAHGRWGAAAGSLALRVVTPVAGALVGGLVGSTSNTNGWDGLANGALGMALGFFLGTGVASALDSAALSHEKTDEPPKDEDAPRAARPAPVRLVPLVSLTPEGGNGQAPGARGLVGVGATF